MKATILNIGDELLSGLIVNTNATFIAQQLDLIGVKVIRIDTVSDNGVEISNAVDQHLTQCDIIIITGGLGPTNDDITKYTLANKFGMSLQFNELAYINIENLFKNRGLGVTETNRLQAMLPDKCTVLINTQGTAPGMWFDYQDKIIVSLPGVPFEMKYLMENEVLPRLKSKCTDLFIVRKLFHTTGVAESHLQDMLIEWERNLPSYSQFAYLPEPGIVKLRLSFSGNNEKSLNDELNTQEQKLREILGNSIFGINSETIEEIVGNLLNQKKQTLSIAESCTGGYISHLITSISGSSQYFKGSVISYSNKIKSDVLEVDENIINKYGAVSKEVVIEMARGVQQLCKTDYAISISGIAGPDGGTKDKPVGTVWISIATPNTIEAKHFLFGDNRQRNIRRAAIAALNELRKELLNK